MQSKTEENKEKLLQIIGNYKKSTTFAFANRKNKVPWMSGLVSGLQNRVRRFESARNLNVKSLTAYNEVVSDFSFTKTGEMVLHWYYNIQNINSTFILSLRFLPERIA